ncbi:MAG: hypothetical protein JWR09_4221 [Mucilaginibacter sp.]|nr:hypothetical protein [Mucilaginibacter sp.]
MKLSLLLIFTVTLFYSCTNNNKKSLNNANELVYNTDNIDTGVLNVEPALTGDIKKQELNTHLKLSNTDSKDFEIQEIAINTPNGSNSLPTTSFAPFLLKQGKDTTIALNFIPFNDYKLYQITGMHGSFKPVYNVAISYKLTGSNSISTLSLKSAAEKGQYLAYSKKNVTSVIGYSFNTTKGFSENQKKYLEALKQIPQPPFVFLSDQEIAVSGFNFRLKNYYLQDTLHAELFIVNHSDFLVKIIPDAFDITTLDKSLPGDVKTVSLEKVSGTQQNISMIEKGDRMLIHFKKHIKLNAPGKERLQLHITKVFLIKGDKALFTEDLELLPVNF